MSPENRIEEAHGLWELAVQRVAALAEAISLGTNVPMVLLTKAVSAERAALENWREVSGDALRELP